MAMQYYTPEELLQVNTSTECLETATLVIYFKVKRGHVFTTLKGTT